MLLLSKKQDWLGNIKGDVLAGTVVALALIPEAIAFSIIAGVDPKVGLYASFCMNCWSNCYRGKRFRTSKRAY
jgi:SulP family sulfate permease